MKLINVNKYKRLWKKFQLELKKFCFSDSENPIVYDCVRLNIFPKNISNCLLALSDWDFTSPIILRD
jgi:hypothetical protein